MKRMRGEGEGGSFWRGMKMNVNIVKKRGDCFGHTIRALPACCGVCCVEPCDAIT